MKRRTKAKPSTARPPRDISSVLVAVLRNLGPIAGLVEQLPLRLEHEHGGRKLTLTVEIVRRRNVRQRRPKD